jgi:hypothetical protein
MRMMKSGMMEREWHVERLGENKNAYRILVGTLEGKKSLGRARHRHDNIKMDVREVGWAGTDRIPLPHDRDQWKVLVNPVMSLRFKKGYQPSCNL